MNPDNPNFRTPEEEARAEELVKLSDENEKLKRVVEKLREQRNIENGAKWNARGFGTVSGIDDIKKMDAQLDAIEKGKGE